MNRIALSLALLAVPALASAAPPRGALRPIANPGGVVAAELGFAALAQEKGQWTAFRAPAVKGAKMFAPGPVEVSAFLKGRKDPPVSVKWQPHMVWSSCDGSIAVTRGAWQRPDKSEGSWGYFITVWQRQKNGEYKWVLDQGDTLAKAEPEPEAIDGVVADCPARGRGGPPPGDRPGERRDRPGKPYAPEPLADPLSGQSNDRTLAWTTTVDAGNGREFSLTLRKDGGMREVLHASVKPSAG